MASSMCSSCVSTEALKAMEKVASHINDMQKIYEDYGTVFDQLVAEQSTADKEVTPPPPPPRACGVQTQTSAGMH